MSRFRPLWFEQFEQRLLLTSGAGVFGEFPRETSGSAVFPVSEGAPSVQFRLEPSDLVGQPIRSVQAGEEFYLNAYVTDLRSQPQGVFAAYLDLAFDAGRIVPAGDVEFGSVYKNGRDSGGAIPGLLDEVGGFSGSIRPLGAGEVLLFRAPFRAETAGTASFLTQPATSKTRSVVLLYGEDAPLANDRIDFGLVSLNVVDRQAPSLEDTVPPPPISPISWDIGIPDRPSPARPDESAEVQLLLPSILLTAMDADLLAHASVSGLANPRPAALRTDRVEDTQAAYHLLDLGSRLAEEFNFAVRSQHLASNSPERELFQELRARRPAGRNFSLMDTPDFASDDGQAGAGSVWILGERAGRPMGWSHLLHDDHWLTAGLLRIEWAPKVELGEDAALADAREMFDLGLTAYEIARTRRLPDSKQPRINGDDDEGDEWLVRLDRAFSKETEMQGIQGTMMALETGVPTRPSPGPDPPNQKAATRHDSGEAAPINSPNNKRAEDVPERKTPDDTTPAA